MKRLLLFFTALAVTCTSLAQDIIVTKNGTPIKAKVLDIGTSEVKYTLYNSTDKNTYTISISELLSINYENGEKDVFDNSSDNKNNGQPQKSFILSPSDSNNKRIDINTQLLAEQKYAKAKNQKFWGVTSVALGGVVFVVGTLAAVFCVQGDVDPGTPPEVYIASTFTPIGAGALAGGIIMLSKHKRTKAEARELLSHSLIEKDIKIFGRTVTPSIDLLTTNSFVNSSEHGIGLGLKYRF